jgi:4-hydroxy-tetrahydrodipicolinate reductase
MKLIINGAAGRMGSELLRLVTADSRYELAAAVDNSYDGSITGEHPRLDAYQGTADCIIDFSHHSAAAGLSAYAAARRIPLVIGTTGQTAEDLGAIREASKKVPVLISGNMSLGIATLVEVVKMAVKMFPDADVEIIEKHHNQKLDVPSGTALMLADTVKSVRGNSVFLVGRHENGRRSKDEIGIHSLRMGGVVGEHEVIICTGSQTLSLKHTAHNRALFAEGALTAARFIVDKVPGLYAIQDMFK